MESLAIQRSLTILEDRYRELREIGERRLQEWEMEKGQALQTIEQLKTKLQDSKAELKVAICARDAQSKEKDEALKTIEQLKTQLEESKAQLQIAKSERDAQA